MSYVVETIIPTIANLGVTYVGHCQCGHATGIHGDYALAESQISRCMHF